MPRRKLPYVLRETSRHGKTLWYFRQGKGPRIRLPDEYGSKAFLEAYKAALAGQPIKPNNAAHGSLKWLAGQWMRSSDWTNLAPATRKKHSSILGSVLDKSGHVQFTSITRKHIVEGKERRSATPAAANNFLKTMRSLFRWAMDAELTDHNPAERVSLFPESRTGFEAWTADDVARFRAHWPIGTRERLAFELFYRTGLRRSDIARLGPEHIQDGVLSIQTLKTGTWVHIHIDAEFSSILKKSGLNYNDATGHYSFGAKTIMGYTQESMSNWFRRACRAAGVEKPAHGIRKLSATELAEGGATDQELMASHGWTTSRQSVRYTREADRKRLALAAQSKRKPRTSE